MILAQALKEWRQLSSGSDGCAHRITFSSDKEYIDNMLYNAYCQYIPYTAYIGGISCDRYVSFPLREINPISTAELQLPLLAPYLRRHILTQDAPVPAEALIGLAAFARIVVFDEDFLVAGAIGEVALRIAMKWRG
jgi:hypothetical protein